MTGTDLVMRKPRITVIDGKVTTTSLVVAEHFEKNHFDVLRAIRDLIDEVPHDFTARNFAVSDYLDSSGRKLPMYRLGRDGFSLLAMGFTGKKALAWKIAYIEAFNAMEQALAGRSPGAGADAASLDSLSPRQFLQLYYALDRQTVSASILWQLIQMGAHRGWVKISVRVLIRGMGIHLSAGGVHKAARRLQSEGLIAIDARSTTRYFVIAKAVRSRIDGALAGARHLPGLPQPDAAALPGTGRLHLMRPIDERRAQPIPGAEHSAGSQANSCLLHCTNQLSHNKLRKGRPARFVPAAG